MLLRTIVAVCLTSIVLTVGASAPEANAQAGLLGSELVMSGRGDIHSVVIMGKDNRRPVPEEYRKLAVGVGLLVNRRSRKSRYRCTAFCVGDDLIASNAHCLEAQPKTNRKHNLRNMVFERRDQRGRVKRSRLSWNNIGRRGEPRLSLLIDDNRGANKNSWPFRDWAVARLKENVCAGHVLKFADVAGLQSWTWPSTQRIFMIGYHGDLLRRSKSRAFSDCVFLRHRFFSSQAVVGQHDCDGVSGYSGSPIFTQTEDGPRVVAINYGWYAPYQYRRLSNGRRQKVRPPKTNAAIIPFRLIERLDLFARSSFVKEATSLVRLQNRLKKLGYFKGKTGNRNVSATRDAILKFEVSRGRTPLGIPTQQLLAELKALAKQ